MSRLRGAATALVLAVLVLAGCTSEPAGGGANGARDGAATAPSGPSCLPSPAPSGTAGVSSGTAGASPGRAADGPVLDLTLPCFVGGQPVRLGRLGTPAVINLWASWCQPCLTELPQIQRFADRAAGRVQVVGVITRDPIRSKPQSVIDDFRLTFPMLYDERATLQSRIGPPVATPTTLLVDAHGRVAYRYSGRPLDDATLAGLVHQHLGVAA
ncbi:TlpA family protein disulfide reductase [Planosporangium thailandense]|uniref:TlpA family protein disulfide reductase n=1 Tax=Planosporangium thailandense TaxID=765197 RepID=A0ABX0XUU3_9ACTN|nr:TlpA disulfide reductase family protein [Planosporangium thailandense]NJC69175.1 TlpA family protein disulfide reductase [Planosporangium thailandense]